MPRILTWKALKFQSFGGIGGEFLIFQLIKRGLTKVSVTD
jgi:hypothetical protein